MSETLSAATIAKLERLRERQSAYRQGREDRALLSNKTAIAFVGASCQGKSTVMRKVVEVASDFQIIGTRTSRPPRTSDQGTPYVYYEHTDEGLEPFFAAVAARSLVQYFITAREPHYVYGSAVDDYPAIYNVGDYFADAIADLRTRGFHKVLAASVISPPEEWLPRFEERFPVGHEDRATRREEAIGSFKWSLGQTANHVWTVNHDGQADRAAHATIDAMLGRPDEAATARRYAFDSLVAARSLPV
jgi:hypothetical protein